VVASQTLAAFVQSLKSCPKIQRNIFAKKYIKSIIYSKNSIQINLFVSCRPKEKIRPEGAENPVRKKEMAPRFRVIPIILPNTIHACKRKNL